MQKRSYAISVTILYLPESYIADVNFHKGFF